MSFKLIVYAPLVAAICILNVNGEFAAEWSEKTGLPEQDLGLDRHHHHKHHHSFTQTPFDEELDCSIKLLAFNYSKTILAASANFGAIFDGLQLGEVCGHSKGDLLRAPAKRQHANRVVKQRQEQSLQVFVDARRGNDARFGSQYSPLLTIQAGVDACRQRISSHPGRGVPCTVYLREGHYFLNDTLRLSPRESGITISNYAAEAAVLSGGKVLKTTWQNHLRDWMVYEGSTCLFEGEKPGVSTPRVKYYGKVHSSYECQQACMAYTKCSSFAYYDTSAGGLALMCYFRLDGLWSPLAKTGAVSGKLINIYVADVSGQGVTSFTSLFVNGKRAVRARFPNGDPETTGVYSKPNGLVDNAKKWLPPTPKAAATELHLDQPARSKTTFPTFQIGIGGPVAAFNPPKSYWGTSHPAGGGGATYKVPSGLEYADTLEMAQRPWKNPSTGIVHAFQAHYWGNWQFNIDDRNDTSNVITWSRGGFQEARGSATGGQWYVENIFEELDVANEWYLDEEKMKLYYFPNGTTPLPSEVIAPQLKSLVSIVGSQRDPVTNTKLHGVTLTHTATTYMDDYEVPSGGDWAVHRDGTVFIEGTENTVIDGCMLDSPGGNGIFVSNYNLNATISNNELFKLGDNGIVLVGSSDLIDGTNGNQPRKTNVLKNIVRENGVWGKQTYALVQSLSCETLLDGNVFFSGPRGGINFNDGFGGGNHMEHNLVFNFVRETKDHGPINSWDRQPYLTTVRDGITPSLLPQENTITRNFIINNYQSTWPIDHDDGSCYWTDTFNLLVYGGFKNYLGHTKHVTNNMYVYPDKAPEPRGGYNQPVCAFTAGQSAGYSGYGDVWTNNMCIVSSSTVYNLGSCKDGQLEDLVPYFANNRFFTAGANMTVHCGSEVWSLEQFQARGFDIGTVVSDLPTNDQVIAWSKSFLGV